MGSKKISRGLISKGKGSDLVVVRRCPWNLVNLVVHEGISCYSWFLTKKRFAVVWKRIKGILNVGIVLTG